ncbi:MAG TPA: hypothetical protein VL283_05025 [Candidatus Baltobacteraceae bacterium]|nr:hypothetical protein [Candidatus Baltobacteraceae bacterium]
MKRFRITTVLHPGTTDSTQGLIWAEAYYCEGECFPWLLLTPTQLVLLARAGRITLLALIETTAEEIAAITGCAPDVAAEIMRRVMDDAAYWQGQAYLDECREIQRGAGGPDPTPVDFEEFRRSRPEYRTPSPVELVAVPMDPTFPWPQGEAWDTHMSQLLVGQFEGAGHEIRDLLSPHKASLPGHERYLTDPYVIAKYEARRRGLKSDLARLAEDAKTYELARWLVGELTYELRGIEDYLDRWLPPRQRVCDI